MSKPDKAEAKIKAALKATAHVKTKDVKPDKVKLAKILRAGKRDGDK